MKVTLPPKNDILAPGVFSEGLPGPRWFDFSSAPDVEGFHSSSCATDITWAGRTAFHMSERKPYMLIRMGLIRSWMQHETPDVPNGDCLYDENGTIF